MENMVMVASEKPAIPTVDMNYFYGKRVFLTGHTGFKGSWLAYILAIAGASVVGYSLEPPSQPNLFDIAKIEKLIDSNIGDIRDFENMKKIMMRCAPDIVIHLAAQPLVIEGYLNPRYTYETNVMGTVNLLEAARSIDTIESILNITTDKVYKNNELYDYSYKEDDKLDGYDPYSNSKSCSELVTHSYVNSFFDAAKIPISTARAGNVIGGGDFAANRIIPDCVRSIQADQPLMVRNPFSVRPYQHVLDPLFAYLMIIEGQCKKPELASSYNVGPDDEDSVSTGQLVELFRKSWGDGFNWEDGSAGNSGPHEAKYLKLDSSKLKENFNWSPRWHINDAIKATVEWNKTFLDGGNISEVMDRQIDDFMHC